MAGRSSSQALGAGRGSGGSEAIGLRQKMTATTASVACATTLRAPPPPAPRRRRMLSLCTYANLAAGVWLAAAVGLPAVAGAPPAAAAAATVADSQADRYQVERQLVDLLKKLQDKYQQHQQVVAGNPSAGHATNIDRATDSVGAAAGGGDATWSDRTGDYAYEEQQRLREQQLQQLESELVYRGTENYPPPNVVRSPEGRSAYTNRCRGDTRLCMNSYRIGSKRMEPSNSDLVPALQALSDAEGSLSPSAVAAAYRSERRVRLELIKRKLLDLYEDVRDLEREYDT